MDDMQKQYRKLKWELRQEEEEAVGSEVYFLVLAGIIGSALGLKYNSFWWGVFITLLSLLAGYYLLEFSKSVYRYDQLKDKMLEIKIKSIIENTLIEYNVVGGDSNE